MLDVLKYICAILVIGIHAAPLFFNFSVNLYLSQWLFRFAVPLFVISSGFFFEKMDDSKMVKYMLRIFYLYIFCAVIYLPLTVKTNDIISMADVPRLINILFLGWYHLWYLSALVVALFLSFILRKVLPLEKFKRLYILISISLILVGAFFDEYYKLFNFDILNKIANIIDKFGSTRNYLFMVFPLLTIGRLIYIEREKIFSIKPKVYMLITLLFLVLSAMEVAIFEGMNNFNISCDLTLFNFVPAITLFILTFYYHPKCLEGKTTPLRKQADIIYIIHIWVIEIIDIFFGLTYYWKYIAVILSSCLIAWLFIKITTLIKEWRRKAKQSVNH